jgi:uroporphyrinogen III methyltransferase/synthase
MPGQRTVTSTLGEVAEEAERAGVKPPSITVVGHVAALRERLRWFEDRPLAGKTVAVTRARAQASELAARLRALGAEVVEAPAIRIVPLRGGAPDLDGTDLVCLTSPNGVRLLFERLRNEGQDARALAGRTVAAIGPGTARALRQHGIEPDVVPERSVAESLVEALQSVPVTRALIARAAEARDVLPDALRERGAHVDILPLYETVAETLDDDARDRALHADYITFTSSSTVTRFLDAAGARPGDETRIVSIGPVTTKTLEERGLTPHVEAERHDIDGVVAAIVEDA